MTWQTMQNASYIQVNMNTTPHNCYSRPENITIATFNSCYIYPWPVSLWKPVTFIEGN